MLIHVEQYQPMIIIVSHLRTMLLYSMSITIKQRNLNDYIGINIYFPPDGNIKPLQPHLIEQIAQDLNLSQRAPPRPTPAKYRMITQQDISAPLFDHQFHHCYVIGKLNFLDKFPEATSPMQLIK